MKTALSVYALYKGVKFAKAVTVAVTANALPVLGVCAAGMVAKHYIGQLQLTPNENWVKFPEGPRSTF